MGQRREGGEGIRHLCIDRVFVSHSLLINMLRGQRETKARPGAFFCLFVVRVS